MLSSISFRRSVEELGRFIQRAEQMPQDVRAKVAAEKQHSLQVSDLIVAFDKKNAQIYVDDVAAGPHARQMVSYLL